jgi:hypothetical protein
VMADLSMLAPFGNDKEEKALRRYLARVVRKIVVNAAIHRPASDIMEEVYFAGLYHGSNLSGPKPRARDYIEIAPAMSGRRRQRKAIP